jgi:hypothetical protein
MPFDFQACVKAQTDKGESPEDAKASCSELEKKSASTEIFEENNKLYIKAFLLDSSVNLNEWGVDFATLDANINTYIGKPLVLQDDFEHPNSGDSKYDHVIQYQEKFRIGNIIDIVKKDSVYSAIIEVTDNIAKEAFKAGNLPLYVSPQLFHDGVGQEPDNAAKTWRGTHLAVVKQPAFGILKARVEGQCSGSPDSCLAQLKKASIEKTKCNCVKQAILNYGESRIKEIAANQWKAVANETLVRNQSNNKSVTLSSLDNLSANKSKLDSPNVNTIPQISNEEVEKIQRERDELKAKVAALEGTNNKLTEENKTVSASLDSLKGEYRKDKVSSILSGVFYKTDEDRNAAVESFTKSGMAYEDIEKHVAPLKVTKQASTESKLPVKSAANEDSSELPYWVQIEQFVTGGSA